MARGLVGVSACPLAVTFCRLGMQLSDDAQQNGGLTSVHRMITQGDLKMISGRQRVSGAWHGGRAERSRGSSTHKVGLGLDMTVGYQQQGTSGQSGGAGPGCRGGPGVRREEREGHRGERFEKRRESGTQQLGERDPW